MDAVTCCTPHPEPCGGMEYIGGCGVQAKCRPKCCKDPQRRQCEKLQPCHFPPPPGYPNPPIGNAATYMPPGRVGFPPCPCEPHPCYPSSCRKTKKCSAWPNCPNGRPCYKPLGPQKLCFRPLCCPPAPDCPLARPWPLPCYPRLFKGCKYCPPEPSPPCYMERPPMIVRTVCPCPPKCPRPKWCCVSC